MVLGAAGRWVLQRELSTNQQMNPTSAVCSQPFEVSKGNVGSNVMNLLTYRSIIFFSVKNRAGEPPS